MIMKLAIVSLFAALVAHARANASLDRRGGFDYQAHLGNLSPYRKAPVPSGIREALPEDCTVDQVMLVSCLFNLSYPPKCLFLFSASFSSTLCDLVGFVRVCLIGGLCSQPSRQCHTDTDTDTGSLTEKMHSRIQMHRHGSRYPLASELVFITDLVAKLGNASAAIQKARFPAGLEFLKDGYVSTLGHDDLTAPGRLQLFQHGVE